MKHLFQSIMLTLVVALAFSACSKEQTESNKLKGAWKLTISTKNSAPISLVGINATIVFDNDCKVKKETCTGSTTYIVSNFFSQADAITYTIIDDKITSTGVNGTSFFQGAFTIKTLDKSKLVVTSLDSNGDTHEDTYTKQ